MSEAKNESSGESTTSSEKLAVIDSTEQYSELEQQLAASEQQRGELVELVRIINTHEDSYDDAENVLGKIFYLCNQARQKNEALAKSQGVQP